MNRSLSSMTLLPFHGISAPSSKRSPLIHSVRNPPGLFCQPSPRSVPEVPYPHPPYFCQRVRKRLKGKELSFWRRQKSAKESVSVSKARHAKTPGNEYE